MELELAALELRRDPLDLPRGEPHVEHLAAELEPGHVLVAREICVRGARPTRQHGDAHDDPREHEDDEYADDDVIDSVVLHARRPVTVPARR